MRGCGSGIPHTTRKDDTYAGFCIPKGSAVIANLWLVTDETNRIPITLFVLIVTARAFLHNPKIYSDPFTFNPGRFLGPNKIRGLSTVQHKIMGLLSVNKKIRRVFLGLNKIIRLSSVQNKVSSPTSGSK